MFGITNAITEYIRNKRSRVITLAFTLLYMSAPAIFNTIKNKVKKKSEREREQYKEIERKGRSGI